MEGVEESPLPQLDGEGDEREEEERNCKDEPDVRDEEGEEEGIVEEKVNVSNVLFCIHEVQVNTSEYRPDCRKCRKNYYKILNTMCSHSKIREDCYSCEPIDGWLYKT